MNLATTRAHFSPLLLLLTGFLPALLPAVLAATMPPAPTATITIDATRSPGPFNPLIFGHGNIEAGDIEGIHGMHTKTACLLTGDGIWDLENARPTDTFLAHARATGMTALRYPGGCIAHNFDWRKAVGPRAERGDWQFGLDEFLATCRALNAEPVITVSDYVLPADEMPRHAARLVEYLNAPATSAHPHAMQRAVNGHPEPYAVKYFELGNESDHGNHAVKPRRQFTPAQYARYATDTAAAMRAIDPAIKLGIVTVPGTGENPSSPWNREIIRLAGPSADFVVIHLYAPRFNKNLPLISEDLLTRACMAVGDQIDHRLKTWHAMIREACGRDLPLAVTEFNAAFIQPVNDPKPWRLGYAAALQNADLLRVFLKPENNIQSASYWQFINGYWGMVRTSGDTTTQTHPAYELFRLWGEHFRGNRLVDTNVVTPTADFEGYHGVAPARGDRYQPRAILRSYAIPPATFRASSGNGYTVTLADSGDAEITIDLKNFTGQAHPTLATIPVDLLGQKTGITYRLGFETQFRPTPGANSAYGRQGLTLADSRGYTATKSATAITGAQDLGAWSPLSGELVPRDDCPGVTILGRIETQGKPITGRLSFRNLVLETVVREAAPATALVTAIASTSTEASGATTLYLILFNKSHEQDIPVTINLQNFPLPSATARYWEVNAPSLTSIDGARQTVTAVALPLATNTAAPAHLGHTLPAHSMTAIEITTRH
ncbi:alpha-L-arabinofuranosidase [Opitutaceae bacterium TAV1]|nr:alpha-L-arabinofuranosidase [Opitutaceae bacterium TAV1]